jgi:hypothetical protein
MNMVEKEQQTMKDAQIHNKNSPNAVCRRLDVLVVIVDVSFAANAVDVFVFVDDVLIAMLELGCYTREEFKVLGRYC